MTINPEFLKYDHSDGLSSNVAYAILEDSRGFIWIGTQDGLNRFDGYNFKVYGVGPEGGKFISHSGINALLEDRDGYIWIGTEGGGLNCYDPETEMFWHFFHNPDEPGSLSSNKITSLVEDQNGIVWIGTSVGPQRMQKTYSMLSKDLHIKPLSCTFMSYSPQNADPANLKNIRINSMYVDSYNNLWIGTPNGLNLFLARNHNQERGTFIKYYTGTNTAISLSNNYINAVFEDRDKNLWIGTNKGLTMLSGRGNEGIPTISRQIPISPGLESGIGHNVVYDIIQDPAGNLWLATIGGGLNVILKDNLADLSDVRFINYSHNELDPNSISADAISSLYLSSTSNIWFTTNNKGIGFVNAQKQVFRTIRNNPNNPNSLSHNVVKSIIEDRTGNIWIGTWGGGLVKYIPETEKFKTYTPNLTDPNWLGSDVIQVIVEDREGILWIGTQGMGLYRFNPETEVFNNILRQKLAGSTINSNDVWSLFPSRDGHHLWIGTYGGLDKFNVQTRAVTHYVNDPENDQSISFNEVRSLFEDTLGNLWIGTGGGGLDRLDIDANVFHHYKHDPSDNTSLSNNSIYSLFEDRDCNLWVGTLGGGANLIKAEDKYNEHPVFHHYGKTEGLANDVVKGFLEDNNGYLWISTSNGLSKFNPRSNFFVNYSESDGLQRNVFNLGACLKTREGQLLFGSVDGLTVFSTDDIPRYTIPPQVLITDLKISNRSVSVGEKIGNRMVLDRSIILSDEIEIPHISNVISFEFSALTFSAQERIRYAYRLKGLNERWLETDFEGRSITYSNLRPGKYVFEVRASNSEGIFMDNPTSLSMIIHPPFYRTKVALIFYVLLILLGLYYARKVSRNRIRLKFELEQERTEYQRRKEVDQMKLQFFTNISHEFRTPLTLLMGPLQKLKGKISDWDKEKQYGIMEKNVNRMLRLVNQIIDFRKMDQGALKFKAVEGDVVSSIKEVCSMFDEMAKNKKIKFDQIFYEQEIFTWYDQDKIEKILMNILSNAFQYTNTEGKILVEVDTCRSIADKNLVAVLKSENKQPKAEEYFYISITDTGKGIRREDLELIFNRFYKVEDTEQSGYGGTGMGIGLSLVKKLVEMHRGEIHIRSEINKGSSFTVFFPFGKEYLEPDDLSPADNIITNKSSQTLRETILVDDDPNDITIPRRVSGTISGQGDRKKLPLLLIVEDDHELMEFLYDNLVEKYRIHTAPDGIQALKSVITNHPELVVSDIMMPEMDGIELIKKMKTDIRISHIPVILLTAKSTVEHRLEGLDAGADAYLSKPFHLNNLFAQINNLLKSRKLLKEKFIRDDQIKPNEITLKSIDQKYLEKAITIIEKFIDDPELTVERFAKEMFESRVQLYRKLKGLTGLSPNEFVRNIRIKRAAEILVKEGITVGEVIHRVGFSNRSYFNRCFRQVYDTSPIDYQQANIV